MPDPVLASRAANITESAGPPNFSTSYASTMLTSIIACTTPMIALMFLAAISWVYHYSIQNPRPINKVSGYRLQRFAPLFYCFLVFISMAEIATSTWLLFQYNNYHNYPSSETRVAVVLLLFTACWTTMTASIFAFFFVHPTWSRHPISSIGSQAVWVFMTWLLWLIGSGLVNAALPSLFVRGSCANIVYCSQIRSLFAFSVVESLMLTLSMLTTIWLAWQSTRDALQHADIPTK